MFKSEFVRVKVHWPVQRRTAFELDYIYNVSLVIILDLERWMNSLIFLICIELDMV